MNAIVIKLTDTALMRRACEMTMQDGVTSQASLDAIYLSEHSPARTQLFWVELHDIPTFVSTHLVRHKHGVEHYVKSNRDDRGGDTVVTRDTLLHHAMLLNAQAIINISKERLCKKSHPETIKTWQKVLEQIDKVDPALVHFCYPKCMYRQLCPEVKSCGLFK